MTRDLVADLCVIGAGAGGLSVAAGAAGGADDSRRRPFRHRDHGATDRSAGAARASARRDRRHRAA
jgi:hypothetical protein